MANIDYTNFEYYKLSDVNHDGVQYPGAVVQKNGAVYADQIIWGKVTIDGNEKDKATTEDVLTALESAGSIDPSKIWDDFVAYYSKITEIDDTKLDEPIILSAKSTEEQAKTACELYVNSSYYPKGTVFTYSTWKTDGNIVHSNYIYTKTTDLPITTPLPSTSPTPSPSTSPTPSPNASNEEETPENEPEA